MTVVRDEKLTIYTQDAVAADYDLRWRGRRGAARDERKRRAVRTALGALGTAHSVLDVPCGTGRLSELLATHERVYTGADAALAMLRVATERRPGTRFVAADLAHLPFADSSFDVVVCIRLMHLVRDADLRAAFLRELARVARVGVIVDYRNDRTLRVRWSRLLARVGLRARGPNAHARAAFAAELTAAGLQPVAFVPVRRIPYVSNKEVIAARI